MVHLLLNYYTKNWMKSLLMFITIINKRLVQLDTSLKKHLIWYVDTQSGYWKTILHCALYVLWCVYTNFPRHV